MYQLNMAQLLLHVRCVHEDYRALKRHTKDEDIFVKGKIEASNAHIMEQFDKKMVNRRCLLLRMILQLTNIFHIS